MKFIEHLFDFAAYESCGKCFPCRLGTKRGQELAEKALTSDYKIDKKLFTDLLTTLRTRFVMCTWWRNSTSSAQCTTIF